MAWTDQMRRQCEIGTERYHEALVEAGYIKPVERYIPVIKRLGRVVNPPWPGPRVSPTTPSSLRGIAAHVANKYGFTVDDLCSSNNSREICRARWEAFALAKSTGRYSLKQIGRFFGDRCHTTVHHGLRKHEGEI